MQRIFKTKRTVRRMRPEDYEQHREEVRERLARKVARHKQANLVASADETVAKVDEHLSYLNKHNW